MEQTFWLALGGFSLLMTFAWLFVERRLYVTSGFAAAGWALMAVTADSLTTITQSGSEVATSAGVLAYFCTGLALLSLLALFLSAFGHYPPEEDDDQPGSADDIRGRITT